MKTTKGISAIFIAFLLLISVFAGCAKDGSNEDTTCKTTVSSGKEVESDKTTENETQSSNSTTTGDIIYFGQYEQDNDLTNGKEKIEWRVLTVENGKAFLLADKILDIIPYNEEDVDVTWETCTLRKWMNEEFYEEAFATGEQTKILTTDAVNENSPYFGTTGGNKTKDKVFLLSHSEVTNSAYGFSADAMDTDAGRQAQGTAFANRNGLTVSTGSSHSQSSFWWLRMPGSYQNCACVVFYNGAVHIHGGDYSISTPFGVRPALWIKL